MKALSFTSVVVLTAYLVVSCQKDDPKPVVVSSISIKEVPTNDSYLEGEVLNLSGLVLTITKSDGSSADVPLSEFSASGITSDPSNGAMIKPELKSVTITHTPSGIKVSQPIAIRVVNEVAIKTPPTKLNYFAKENLDLSDLIVKLILDNGDIREVAFLDFGSKGLSTIPINGTPITQELTSVTITYAANSKNVIQPIAIRSVTNVSVKLPPSKVSYYLGEALDLSGLVISVTLDNGDNRDVPFIDFANKGFTTSPANGVRLTRESGSITITHLGTNKVANQIVSFLTLPDIDGNIYQLIKIGNQVWMQENLKTTKYQNGDVIGTTTPATLDISKEATPKYQWAYEANENKVATYGRLYTQDVATDSRNVCPIGWHTPSQTEFQELSTYLITNGYNFDNTTTGNKTGKSVAATTNWDPWTFTEGVPGNTPETNNRSGFTGLPSGIRIDFDKIFLGQGVLTYWWSTNRNSDGLAIAFRIQSFQQEADIVTIGDRNTGAPVRCIKN